MTENDSEITYMLMEPAEMNLVEGSEYELTVTADPAVQMDTEVTIMLDRTNSDGRGRLHGRSDRDHGRGDQRGRPC